jgi:hypothetical protein
MAEVNPSITAEEAKILRSFRSYGVKAHEMLFFNGSSGKGQSAGFNKAMQSMLDRGFVVRDQRHREAYSLSDSGYQAAQSLGKQKEKPTKASA